jgi:hypothetical protein
VPLTQIEMDFMTHHATELHNFDRPMPAHEMLRSLDHTHSQFRGDKLLTFQHVWQEQGRNSGVLETFFPWDESPNLPPLILPWDSLEVFNLRYQQLCPESIFLAFQSNNHPLQHHRFLASRMRLPRNSIIPDFTPEENYFLDAFFDEIRTATSGPCFQAVKALGIPTSEINQLIGYRATELIASNLPWPQPHPNSPPIPWLTLEIFKVRFLPPEPNMPRYHHVELGRPDFSAEEHQFFAHYLHEMINITPGPAHEYLRSQSLSPALMLPLQYSAIKGGIHLKKVLTDPLPPFVIPWGDKAILLTRVLYFCRDRYGFKDELEQYLPEPDDSYLLKPPRYRFFLTQPEEEFLLHYNNEMLNPNTQPKLATSWLWHNDVFPSTLKPFLFAAEQPTPLQECHHAKSYVKPLPPFRPAWFTKEHFEARAKEAIEFYPELKNDPTAIPGYHPAEWPEKRLAWLKSIPTPPTLTV